MGDTKDRTKSKTKKPNRVTAWFKGLQSEFKKVVWPDKITLAKQTVAVVSVTLMLGIIITLVDAVLKYGIDMLVR